MKRQDICINTNMKINEITIRRSSPDSQTGTNIPKQAKFIDRAGPSEVPIRAEPIEPSHPVTAIQRARMSKELKNSVPGMTKAAADIDAPHITPEERKDRIRKYNRLVQNFRIKHKLRSGTPIYPDDNA